MNLWTSTEPDRLPTPTSKHRRASRLSYALLSAVSVALILQIAVCEADQPEQKPNVVFILADDLGWSDVSCYGQTLWETRHIDRLAREGMRFTDAYAAGPVCSPTRASILTGKYPHRLHMSGILAQNARPYKVPGNAQVLPPRGIVKLDDEEVTLAEAFKEAGYRTALVGKWHVGGDAETARQQGFDDVFRFSNNGQSRIVGDRFETDLKAEEAGKWMEANRGRPFFLYFSTNAVHTRIAAQQRYVNHFLHKGLKPKGPWNATYAGFVKHLDDAVGRLLDKLDELELADRTIVVFTSDNGGRGLDISDNAPLRGDKGNLYEGGIREPLVIRWPGVVKPGSVCRTPVISTDFYPTLLDMAGLPRRPQQHLDGVSLATLCRGETALDRTELFWHHPHYSTTAVPCSAVRQGDWKLVKFYSDYQRVWEDDGEGSGRVIERRDLELLQLYNLKEDIGERDNRAPKMPRKVGELHSLLQQHLGQVGARLPIENPDYDATKEETGTYKM